jgi:hypothetical protein
MERSRVAVSLSLILSSSPWLPGEKEKKEGKKKVHLESLRAGIIKEWRHRREVGSVGHK